MSDYNIQLVRRFRKAEKEFQDSDMFLLGLFELASGHAAIKSQENTVNDICDYLTGHVFKNVKGEQIHGGFITECIKKDLEYE